MNEASTLELLQAAQNAENLGQFDQARNLLRKAVSGGSIATESSASVLNGLLHLGKLLVEAGRPCDQEAEEVLTRAHMEAKHLNFPRWVATAIHLLALLERRRGNVVKAQELLDQSPARVMNSPGPELAQLFH